jgi:tellurite methyltransferase
MDDPDWPAYYAVTVDRPPWTTLLRAADAFPRLDPGTAPLCAVDLGCGAGRDARELLRRGWQVIAVDREPAAIESLVAATPADHRARLGTHVADLAAFDVPACHLVNASLSLPFLPRTAHDTVWRRIHAALPVGGRFAAMLFGDRDESAAEPGMTCRPVDAIRADLADYDIEHWVETEEDRPTALGEPHHFHLIEVVAVRR